MIAFVFQRASQCEVPFGSLRRASARCTACAYYGERLHAGDKVRVFLKILSTRHGARRLAVSVFRCARALGKLPGAVVSHARDTDGKHLGLVGGGGGRGERRERLSRETTRRVQRGASPPHSSTIVAAAAGLCWRGRSFARGAASTLKLQLSNALQSLCVIRRQQNGIF